VKLDAKTAAELTLPIGRTDAIFFDDDLPGFGFRIRAGGKRSFVAQYRAAGKQRRQTIGSAAKITALQARAAARQILAQVELGADPQAAKIKARLKAAHTVEAIVDKYLAAKEAALRPATYRAAKAYLSGPYFKPLHPLAIGEVTLTDVAACLTTIAIERGGATAGQARSHLSRLFVWAMGEGLVSENVVAGSNKPEGSAQQRERTLRNFEIVAIWTAACRPDDYDRIIRLLMLTGCRREEIGGLRWDEVDLEKATIKLPKERCKNGHAHAVALTAPALAILEQARQEQGVDRVFVFGAGGAAGFSRWAYGKRGLDARLVGVAPWRLHDLRRTMATDMGEQLGIQPHIVEATLNHWQGNAYNWATYEADKGSAWVRWTEYVTALAVGKSPKIVPLRIA
jgi:integrase